MVFEMEVVYNVTTKTKLNLVENIDPKYSETAE